MQHLKCYHVLPGPVELSCLTRIAEIGIGSYSLVATAVPVVLTFGASLTDPYNKMTSELFGAHDNVHLVTTMHRHRLAGVRFSQRLCPSHQPSLPAECGTVALTPVGGALSESPAW